jgi:hypothetical protein
VVTPVKDSTWIIIAIAFGLLVLGGGAVAVSSLTGVPDSLIASIAQAIATAEGFYSVGSRPQRDNNPGDMTADLIGKAVGFDGPFPVYATVSDGWDNLYAQVRLMFSGSSHYSPSMSLAQIGSIYANGDPNWSSNVASALNVTPDTTLNQLLNG